MSAKGLPRILVLYAHPDPEASVANRAMLAAISRLPHVTVHDSMRPIPISLSILLLNAS